jgi:hypothetical protein
MGGMPDELPLCALLSAAFVAFTVELDNEFEHRMPDHRSTARKARGETLRGPYLVSVAMWANCLRYVSEDGVTVAEVARLARTTTNLDGMRRWGYVTVDGAGRGGGARRSGPDSILRLTAAGRRAHEVWAPLPAEIETRWETRFGSGVVDRLRAALSSVGETFPGLPDTLPILRYGLFSQVQDTSDGSAGELCLDALLSRPLLAFAVGYERGIKLSLAVMLNVVRVLDGDGVRVADLPGLSGVSREAIAMALKLLANARCVEVWSRDRRRMVRLTDRGLNARRRGLRRVRDREAVWHERFGDELRAALAPLVGDGTEAGSPLFAGLEPYPGGWRADVRPPARLPWFPMVLHRGGWPDGS